MSKRVLILSTHWGPGGGVEQVSSDVVDFFVDMGWQVTVATRNIISIVERKRGVKILKLQPKSKILRKLFFNYNRNTLAPFRIRLLASESDLIVAMHAGMLPCLAKVDFEVPIWVWAHGLEVWGQNAASLNILSRTLNRVICVSEFTKQHVSQVVSNSKLSVVYNTVDCDYFKPSGKEHVRRDEILIAGRIVSGRPKGHDILISLIRKVSYACKRPIYLRVVGTGDGFDTLKALSIAEGVEDLVLFEGRLESDQYLKAFQRCALFCMPASAGCDDQGRWYGEGFGIVYVEAAACGRPVIASTQGGAPETIVDGKTGFAVNPDDPTALVEKLCYILNNPDIADEMGRSGRNLVERKFSKYCFHKALRSLIPQDIPSSC